MKYLKTFNESLKSEMQAQIDKYNRVLYFLKRHQVQGYTINEDDYTIDVNGRVFIRPNDEVPDYIKFGTIDGSFECSNSNLKNSNFLPKCVNGTLIISMNHFTNLPDIEYVQDDFDVSHNRLEGKVNFPKHIGGFIDLFRNNITSLEGCPKKEKNEVNCDNNPIENLLQVLDRLRRIIKLSQIEILEKIEEFEIIKNTNEVDLISMNSLFDYYDLVFDPSTVYEIPGYKLINK